MPKRLNTSGKRASPPTPPNPTDAELAILQALWTLGPATVRQVHEALATANRRDVCYTTILKTLQIMADKGLVQRDQSQRTHIYRAGRPREHTQRQLVGDLLEKGFAGSAARLVMSALSHTPASAQELEQIRRLLDRIDGGKP